jgi:hypothetical protein
VVVADASPLIALNQIGELHQLQSLFGSIVVPVAVADEVAPTVALPEWAGVRKLSQPLAPSVLRAQLGPGESEALSLAIEMQAQRLLLDERAGRRLAAALRIPVIGTLGVLLAAKRLGHLASIRPPLEELRARGFWIADSLVEQVLEAAGEA